VIDRAVREFGQIDVLVGNAAYQMLQDGGRGQAGVLRRAGDPGAFPWGLPLGRAAQPAELAPLYVFLASPESSCMTSEVLGVTGGSPIT
jgi:NAD(P)-dependent dehydrogenase (short-subunit alcohol dehydrogenase family)